MSRTAWHRPARITVPPLPAERVPIAAPPQVSSQANSSTWLTTLLPMLSSISIAAYMITYGKVLLIFLAVGIVVVSVGITFGIRVQMRSASKKAKDRQRSRYLEHLAAVRNSAREVGAAQRAVAAWQSPSPERLWAIASHRRRVWERRPADPDFLQLRAGLGRGPLATPLHLNMRLDPSVEYDPGLSAAASRIIGTWGTVGKQAACVDLAKAGVVSLVGPPEAARATCRAMLTQLAVLHAPGDVALMVSTGGAAEWDWATWLPHTSTGRPDGQVSPPPLVAAGFEGLADVVEQELARAAAQRAGRQALLRGNRDTARPRTLVVVIDSFGPGSAWAREPLARQLIEEASPASGISVIALVSEMAREPSRVDARVILDGSGSLRLEARDPAFISPVTEGTADRPDVALCEATARLLAPLMLSQAAGEPLARTVPVAQLLGITDPATLDPSSRWKDCLDGSVLATPVGVTADGDPLGLDLKESAQGGMGPHGLIVGATGSGKSELLRTLLTGLAVTHSPDLLSLVLVDFKGGATFAGMTELPHVAGLITNLADDLALVDRVRDALAGEQQRRQRILRDAGNVDSLREYQARQAAGGVDTAGRPLEPLPYLLVVVDEFGELLSSRPEFINLFVQIGRVGRSLGIHLLLATQRLEEGRLRGLESHLSYRICLRTFSAAESRIVIGTADAYHLPHLPGSAYLKVGESVYERFRVAHVSAPYLPPGEGPSEDDAALPEPAVLRLREPGDHPAAAGEPALARSPAGPLGGPTQLHVLVDQVKRAGQPVHQVWLPPLPAVIPLDGLLGPLSVQDGRGLQATMWPLAGSLRFPVGVIDLPLRQEQQPLVLDFGRTDPHLLIVGAPQSGKSTLLRTLMLSGMLTHTPEEMQFACLDYGGGSLYPLAQAPHVSGVAVRGEPDRARRVLAEASRLISERERLFRETGAGSMAEFRRRRDQGTLPDGVLGADVFVVIDGWGVLRGELSDADTRVLDIAARGPGAGVHLVMTASRWGDLRMNLRDAVGARLELRLNDPSESEVSRAVSRTLPPAVPGRGVTRPGLLYQAVAPRLDGRDTVEGLGDAQEEILGKITLSWEGRRATPIRLLPASVHVREVAAQEGDGQPGVAVALGETDLRPVHLDLAGPDQHFLVIGDGGSGKSVLLRTWMRGLAARHSPAETRFMVADYRRSLMGVTPAPYVGAYAGDSVTAAEYARQLAETLAQRLPPSDISAGELRQRGWWTGPDLYLVVDDYDLVAEGMTASPLQPLAAFIPHGREIGFHVVLARRSGGVSRALVSDPLIARAREVGAAGVMLACDAREGVLLGGERGTDLPPGRGVLVRRRRENELVQVLLSGGDDATD